MAEYLHPGVYIEEIERGPRPIEGVPTSTAAFLGETERGPIKPRLVTSFKEYERWFGSVFSPDKFLPHSINGFFENGGRRVYVCRIVGDTATPAQAEFGNFIIRASGPGSWGKRLWVRVEPSTTKKPVGGVPQPIGFRIRLFYWATVPAGFQPFDPVDQPDRMPRATQVEDFDDLSADESSPDYYGKRFPFVDLDKGEMNQGPDSSTLGVLVHKMGTPLGLGPDQAKKALAAGGVDHTPALLNVDYVGGISGQRRELQGLSALELDPYREVALVYAPAIDKAIVQEVVKHCERLRFRFAVVDAEKGDGNDLQAVDPRTKLTDTTYAGYYFPWVLASDPKTGAQKLIPPGGHVLGVYARTDNERGVFKAPANEILRGALDLQVDINDSHQDVLNPRGANAIRRFPGRGIRVWGARTLSSNSLWKYVSVRRLFIFLERSIFEGTQWVVFEPNDPKLWEQVKSTIRIFLRNQWRQGALFGRTEEQAFFITCDERVMSQDDILNGRLVCEIGIAPVRPAEFVIFRIFQNTAEAQR